jgi:hypothetical protein
MVPLSSASSIGGSESSNGAPPANLISATHPVHVSEGKGVNHLLRSVSLARVAFLFSPNSVESFLFPPSSVSVRNPPDCSIVG